MLGLLFGTGEQTVSQQVPTKFRNESVGKDGNVHGNDDGNGRNMKHHLL